MYSAQQSGFTELVTVFRPANNHELILAQSLLQSAGINFFVKGEGLQKLYPGVHFGFGIYAVELQVAKKDAPVAAELLRELQKIE
ncbi:MAG: DUF2007 domain-containing protein [Firmicutes bacterium]|nr:DUF2007 domain-containing protein [Bacillota bacterium]